MTRRTTATVAVALAATLGLLAAACSTGGGSDPTGSGSATTTSDPSSGGPATSSPLGSGTSPLVAGLRIEVLSSQPDRVSGDDARIRVTPGPGSSVGDVRVRVNDTDATRALTSADGRLEGVVSGLIEGNNTITATAGGDQVVQRIRAWPLTGPVISGPHLPLLACSTEEHGLGAPVDDDCSAPRTVTWSYVTTEGALAPLRSFEAPPPDLGTAEIGGRDTPLYVRHERGVINRSIYDVSSIDTTPGDDDASGPGWNRKVVHRFGGGCGTTYGQGTPPATTDDVDLLRSGYAVATASFNNSDVQCNDVLSAETTMMVKERVIESLGAPDLTIGEGSGGGAAQLHLLAQNYPGLVNGIVASSPLPDVFSVWSGVTDCGLLLRYYGTAAGRGLSDAQRTAINGHATARTCPTWADTWLGAIDPTDGCDPAIPESAIYDPVSNRGGLRCTLQDANRNQMRPDPATGWAQRPLDNVGVQYGLEALAEGVITVDQFLDLNDEIGGYDTDGTIVAQRAEADPEAVLHAYETGRVAMGGGDLTFIPIIDVDVFDDPSGATTDRFRAFSLRDRLLQGNPPESVPGFQIWTSTPADHDVPAAVAAMDEWLSALRDDEEGGALADALIRTRPEGVVEACAGEDDPCADRFPIAGDPRTAAGAPRSNQVLKCQLKAIDPDDYGVEITAAQLRELRATFPQGVCDWSGPSVGEMVPANPDRSYEDVPSPGQSA